MVRHVRITLKPTIDNTAAPPFYFDTVLESDGTIVGKQMIFGAQFAGSINGDNCPIILTSDGKLDFGAAYENLRERFGSIDLRSGKIIEGRIVNYRFFNGDADCHEKFRISTICSLPMTK